MKPIADGWHHHRDTLPAHGLDARARFEIERAYYAGAEHVVDSFVDMNDAGLSLPFVFALALTRWSAEYSGHDNHLTREGTT